MDTLDQIAETNIKREFARKLGKLLEEYNVEVFADSYGDIMLQGHTADDMHWDIDLLAGILNSNNLNNYRED